MVSRRHQDFINSLAKTRAHMREQEVFSQGSPLLKAKEYASTQAIAQHLARGGWDWPGRISVSTAYAWSMSGLANYLWEREHDESLVGNWKFHTKMRNLRKAVKQIGIMGTGGSTTPTVPGGYQIPGQSDRPAASPQPVEFSLSSGGPTGGYMKQVLLVPGLPPTRSSPGGGGGSIYVNQIGVVNVQFMGNKNASSGPFDPQPSGFGLGVQAQASDTPPKIYPTIPDAPVTYYTLGNPYPTNSSYFTWGAEDTALIALTAPYDGLPGTGLGASVLYPTGGATPYIYNNTTAAPTMVAHYDVLLSLLPAALADPQFADIVDWYSACTEDYAALDKVEHYWDPVGDFINSADVMVRYGWVHLRGIMWAGDYRGLITFYLRDAKTSPTDPNRSAYLQPADSFVATGEWEGRPTKIAVEKYNEYTALSVLNPQPGQLYAKLDGIKWPLNV